MKRFTTTLFSVAQDFASQSWIAWNEQEAEEISASLKRLGFSFSEESPVGIADGVELFDVLVVNSHKGYRTTKTCRTGEETRDLIDNLLGNGHGFPTAQVTKLNSFFAGVDDNFDFSDQYGEVSIQRAKFPVAS